MVGPAPPAQDALVVRPGTPADDAARDAFCRAHPRGTFFHLSGWRRAVERQFRHEPADLLAFRGETLVGCLPLMRCRGLFGGSDLISMPYAVYGGALGADAGVAAALVDAAKARAEAERVGRLELRCREDPPSGLLPLELYATFIQELPSDAAEVLARMPKKARAEARHARERHGLELVEGRWYLDDLYRLFQANKHGLGSPGLPLAWFHGLAGEFGRDVVVHLVHQERRPLAAVMSFVWNDTLLAYYAGTAPGADRAFSASNFMYMALREWAVGAGFRFFDFGRSRSDSGAFDFKRRQGFEPLALSYQCHLVRSHELPSFNPSNPRTKLLRDTWSRLPEWMAVRLSEWLARYLT